VKPNNAAQKRRSDIHLKMEAADWIGRTGNEANGCGDVGVLGFISLSPT